MRIAWALAAALLATGCGSSDKPAADATPAPIENAAVAEMPEAPTGTVDSFPQAQTAKVHDAGQLHAAFTGAEALWEQEFSVAGLDYQHAKLAFFRSTVRTPCGEQSRETGPFYCPASLGVYLNTQFFDELARAYGLTSGFAAGYVTAHEVGHHVQQLLGVHQRVAAANQSDPGNANARSVQVELQADCYAGVWLHTVSAAGQLSQDDVNDIIKAAAIVGDDFQRNQAGAELAPETWTHGSSEQRVHWVSVGLQTGRPDKCDTFSAG